MRQTTTGEVRRAERKATGCSLGSPATRTVWLQTDVAAIELRRLDQRENPAQWDRESGEYFDSSRLWQRCCLSGPLSGVFAGSAAASEGDDPARPASFLTWHTDNFFISSPNATGIARSRYSADPSF
jgi:hypothetical protein